MATIRASILVVHLWTTWQLYLRGTNAQGSPTENEQTTLEPSTFYFHQSEYPRDCSELHDQCRHGTTTSGVRIIKPEGYPDPFEVYCDSAEKSEGWTVIQRRRLNGTVGFDRDWESYVVGFGFLSHDFWIGNEVLSYLTNQKEYELLIEMTTAQGVTFNQSYSSFRLGDGFSSYILLSAAHQPDPINFISWCPNNMVFGNCTCGQRHCRDPEVCQDTCDGDRSEGCICPDGYYMEQGNCVSDHQCGCYFSEEQIIVPENATQVNRACTSLFTCVHGVLVEKGAYQCSPDAVCEERDGLRKCHCNDGYIGDGETCTAATDCQEVYDAGYTEDGAHAIKPTNWTGPSFDVYCNMTGDGGGWTVFQRRIDGSVDFDLDWADYKQGFGHVEGEHWLGNEKLFYLTGQRSYELRIDMVYKDGRPYYAEYDSFGINNEGDNYRLSSLGTYSGDSGHDSLEYNRDQEFTTRDRDNDRFGSGNCATHPDYFRGGWWYRSCSYACLNGVYNATDCSHQSIVWRWSRSQCSHYNIKYTEMKIRPV